MMRMTAVALAVLVALVAAPGWSEEVSDPTEEAAGSMAAAEPAAPAEEVELPAPGRVERGVFTTAVVGREPQDSLDTLSNRSREVFYFTEIREAPGQTITHRWEWNGKQMAEVSFEVKGPRWRVHSSKRLDPNWVGEWTVTVLDSADRVLSSESFTYTDAGAEAVPATEVGEEAPAPGEETPPAAPEPEM
jgi:hypothetical protein